MARCVRNAHRAPYGGVPVSTGYAKFVKHGEIADNLLKRRRNKLNANHNVYSEVAVAA